MSLNSIERRAVGALALGLFCVQVDFFALSLAIPRMAQDFDQPSTNLQWVLSAYMIAIGAFLVPVGKLGDVHGRKRAVLIGLVVFGLASLACGLAQNLVMLIAFRAIQGIGAALLLTVSVAALSNSVRDESRASSIGILFGLANIGTAVGPFIGGLLTQQLSWRWVFMVNVPLIIIAFFCCLRWLPESRDASASRRIDSGGLAAIVLAVAAVAFAADRGNEWGWLSPRLLLTLGAGVLLLIAFVLIEQRVTEPLVDLSLFRNRRFVLITVGGTISNVAYSVTILAATIYLQQGRGLSPIMAGVVFMAPAVAVAFSGPLSGRLAGLLPTTLLIPIALLIAGVTLFLVSLVSAWGWYVPLLAIAGLGLGLGWTLPNIGTQMVVDPRKAGAAAGVNLTSMITIGGIGVALGGTLIEIASGAGGVSGYAEATQTLLRIIAVMALVAGVLMLAGHFLVGAPKAQRAPSDETPVLASD